MSHFTVMVLTESDNEDELEALLEPYNENTRVDPYWSASSLSWERTYYSSETYEPEDGERLKADATDEELVAFVNAVEDDVYRIEDGEIQVQSTYNPDSKWDYWRIGGRWAGRLQLVDSAKGYAEPLSWEWKDTPEGERPNGYDQARKGDIDIDRMRFDAQLSAETKWDTYADLVSKHGDLVPWDVIREKHGPENINAARDEYHAQPIVKAAAELELIGWASGLDEQFLGHTKESYIQSARDWALCGYAFLSAESGWLEPGQMGWWGMSSDTNDSRVEYGKKVAALIDAAPDSAVITLIDCHI